MEKERGIIIIGGNHCVAQTFQNLVMNENGDLVHINQNSAFDPEPIMLHSPFIMNESKINYDKYGKILTNKGSNFHK